MLSPMGLRRCIQLGQRQNPNPQTTTHLEQILGCTYGRWLYGITTVVMFGMAAVENGDIWHLSKTPK